MARFSRSRSRSPRYSRRYSRSRSRSGTPPPSSSRGGGSRRRSHSRSPMSSRRRHEGNRDNPSESNCIGVFGLSLYTTERELEKEFSRFGPLQKVLIVLDNQTGRSRGFAFITFESQEDAKAAKAAMTDQEIDGRRIRVDYSVTKRAHTPTPGVYMGRPTYSTDRGRGRGRGGYDRGSRGGGYDRGYERDYHGGHDRGYGSSRHYSRRSPSPYHRGPPPGRHYRSRSRSYSPRYRDNYY